ncbi:succinate dehydrogenase assembly factor 2, partial [Mycobacterium tuberculosis]|nr:succinate dehydrogenase assembly factor 2 [Mycobacterium tuberculosis]
LSSGSLDVRRKRMLLRARHRGMKEMDLILGGFADAHLANFDDAELDVFERLLDESDHDILAWIVGDAPVPARADTPLFQRIRVF